MIAWIVQNSLSDFRKVVNLSSKQRTQMLARAIAALGSTSETDVDKLSVIDLALMLYMLADRTDLGVLRELLAIRLLHILDREWIATEDLFTVFLVMTALWKHDPTRVSGDNLTAAIERLVTCEVKVGGPYKSHGEVDIAANLQISVFIRLVARPLPNVDALFDKVPDMVLASPYLRMIFTQTYADQIVATKTLKGAAFVAASLVGSQSNDSKVGKIITAQRTSGLWAGESLLPDCPSSSLTTTAFIVGLVARFCHDESAEKQLLVLSEKHNEVYAATKQIFTSLSEPLRSTALTFIEKVCSAKRGHEITLLPYLFAHSLKNPLQANDHHYTQLGVANVCGWVAYTIYDDFLDDEGIVAQLPVANVAARASLEAFRTALPDHAYFQQRVLEAANGLDEANAWEIAHCRFEVSGDEIMIATLPDYDDCAVLATRSFGHALGPIGVMLLCGSTVKQSACVESAFRHFLIASQLNDDMADWEDDLRAGQINYVVAAILKDLHCKPGAQDLPKLIERMQKQFRQVTLVHVCTLILKHLSEAKKDFAKSGIMQDASQMIIMLDKIEATVMRTLDVKEKAQKLTKFKG